MKIIKTFKIWEPFVYTLFTPMARPSLKPYNAKWKLQSLEVKRPHHALSGHLRLQADLPQ